MKQIEVTLLGQSYRLGCPDGGEDALLAAVDAVDRELSAIRDAGKVKARERMAVLAALNLAYQLAERAAPAPPPPARGTAEAGADAVPTSDLQALISRIDAALGDDGQLL